MELDMFHSGCHPCEVMLLTISALQMRHRGLKILASLAEMELKPRHEQEWLPEGLWQCCGCRFYSTVDFDKVARIIDREEYSLFSK